jgi:hypothetical protein
MDRVPIPPPSNGGVREGIANARFPKEDIGIDQFIRPGSLIYGVHSRGAVMDDECSDEDTSAPIASRTKRRHTSRSMLLTLAGSGGTSEGRLLRAAVAEAREKESGSSRVSSVARIDERREDGGGA